MQAFSTCDVWASPCGAFPCRGVRASAVTARGLVVAGPSQARHSTRVPWDGILTTGPPWKSQNSVIFNKSTGYNSKLDQMRMKACDMYDLLPLKEHLCHCYKSQILRLKLLTSETKKLSNSY